MIKPPGSVEPVDTAAKLRISFVEKGKKKKKKKKKTK
jgi:hypothetical protein